jgi:hypothetical protein
MLTLPRFAQKYFVGAFLSATCVLASTTVHASGPNLIDASWGTGAGSFELVASGQSFVVTYPPGGSMWLAPGSAMTIQGWTVGGPGDGVDWLTTQDTPVFNMDNGIHAVDLQRTSNSSISTSILTTPNHVYELSFAAAAIDIINANTGTVSAGAWSTSFTVLPRSISFTAQTWVPFEYYFTAGPGSTTTIQFTGTAQQCCYGPVIDSVSVVAVPEPSTTMLLGMGLIVVIGTGLRRRSARASEMHA